MAVNSTTLVGKNSRGSDHKSTPKLVNGNKSKKS